LNHRKFQTSFESVLDFQGFFVEPQNNQGTASHALSAERSRTGAHSHKGWIWGPNPIIPGQDTNHRGYPTVQFYKMAGGGFRTPATIDFWVWLDLPPMLPPNGSQEGEWFSLATLARRADDAFWDGVLINVSHRGIVHLMHVPTVGLSEWTYQDQDRPIPTRQWVNIHSVVDFASAGGYAKVWMDGVLVSEAPVQGGHWILEQAHFGLYAPPSMASGEVFNDDLVIKERTIE
jgi:hypothetical protein